MRNDSLLKGGVLEKDSQDGPAAVSVLHADLAWDSEVLTFSNRYLTFAKNASQDSIINLSCTIDPFNILGP